MHIGSYLYQQTFNPKHVVLKLINFIFILKPEDIN